MLKKFKVKIIRRIAKVIYSHSVIEGDTDYDNVCMKNSVCGRNSKKNIYRKKSFVSTRFFALDLTIYRYLVIDKNHTSFRSVEIENKSIELARNNP